MFNFQASIQASSQQRALHPGPGCRTFITILGIVMSWSVAQVSAGWAAIPNAFHPLWVWRLSTWLASWLCVVQESFYFSLRKAVTFRLWWHCGCRFPFFRTLFPSSCDVFSWLLSSFVTSLVCTFLLSRFVHNIMTLYGITHHCSVVVWVSWHHFSPHKTVYESHM